nr:Nonribosomal peptide synthetase 8-like protein 3 [Colletotrichum truncatum]KAF6780782.1 Nonribosomal peptide synthetase 8-like protein 3 [Colletotrichum truncatum]
MNGEARVLHEHEISQRLTAICSEILCIPVGNIESVSSFVSLGGDSFKAVNFFQKCTEQGLAVRFQDLLHKSMAEIAHLSAISIQGHHDSSTLKQRGSLRHKTYPLMPDTYNFSKILQELRDKHALSQDDVEDIYPLSPMQESMYIGQKMSSKRLYRTRGLFVAASGFDLEHFKATWGDIIRRHQTLRTIYVETSDPASERLLDAVVLKEKPGRITVRQYHHVEEVHQQFAKDISNDQEDQHHVTIYCGPDKQKTSQVFLQLDLNHLTVDGSSLMIIIHELVQGLRGLPVIGPAAGYGKYIDYLQNQVDEDEALNYWIDFLEEAEPCYFPTMNDNQKGERGSAEVLEISLDTSMQELRTFCRDYNVTISNVLQAVWALVLHTYTRDRDVCFGYLSSGRSLPIVGASEIVGPMMNLLVCRVNSIEEKSIGDLLEGIRQDFVNSLPHQCFSIGKVQRILGSHENKLFNTIMTSYYSPDINDNENTVKLVASHNASDFDIVIKIVYSDSDIRVRLAYSTAALSSNMAQNVSCTFSTMLKRMIEAKNLKTSIQPLTLISPHDMHQITDWNNNALVPNTPPTHIHQLIENNARIHPDAPAICAWDGDMSYKELDEAASCVAGFIINLGIGPGAYVPLYFEKSKWFSVALLAVMKSGNAFVPLDISNPPRRNREILKQVGISEDYGLVICSSQQASKLDSSARNILELNEEQLSTIASTPNSRPVPSVVNDDPIYVIFTSGSTGVPKGVIIEHGSYAYAFEAHNHGLHLSSSSRVLQFASYGFDTSMEDHLTTLAIGACLCVPSEEMRLSLPDLTAFATKSQANWAHLTPSFAEMLSPSIMPTMKTMVLGGEAMSGKNIRNWSRPGQTELVQVYGPSECCVTSTISPKITPESDPTNIGKSIPGCRSWVVRPEEPNLLQAIGAVGELLIEGPIVARGYLNDPKQTAECFVTGLKWAPQKRFYRSGDLVKYDSKGDIHFVGRADSQTKLRGQRLELGEIERQLILEPGVRNCLVLVPKSGPCGGRLVALVTLASSSSHSEAAVSTLSAPVEFLESTWLKQIGCMRDFLLDRVPHYMTPEIWIIAKSIARNSSSKLERKEVTNYLETMTESQYANLLSRMEEKSVDRPGNETELLLQSIWSEVLNVPKDQINWNSSFYYLGGDSISAMAVSSIARQKGLNILAADILRCRSIERLAKLSAPTIKTPFKPTFEASTLTEDPFPLSPIQQMHFQASPNGDALDQQTMVVQLTKDIDQEALLNGLNSISAAHPMLRARFERHNGEWMQRISKSEANQSYRIRFHSRDQLDYVIECIADGKRSLDLTNGPLVGIDVFKTRRQTLLSITIHHLVVDTVSWRTLFRELENFLLFGGQVEAEMTSFQTWCSAQRQHARNLKIEDVLPVPDQVPATDLGYWNMNGKDNRFKDSVLHKLAFRPNFGRALSSVRDTDNFAPLDIMITSIGESFHDVFDRSPAVFIEGHGRELLSSDMNPWETVGWFTTFSPVFVKHHDNILDTLSTVRELRFNTPLSGLPYFMSGFLSSGGSKEYFKARHWPMEITLNYLGAFQQFERQGSLFKRCDDNLQSRLSELRRQQRANSARYALISILAVMKDDELSVEIEWNSQMSHQDELMSWACRLEKPNNVYSQHFLFRLHSQELLQPERLYAAWKQVVMSHQILRTLFLEDDEGMFLQVVLKTATPDIEIIRLEDAQDLSRLWENRSNNPGLSPLGGKILHKLSIFSAKDGSAYCFLDKNHIITDGTTSRLLIRDFLNEYEGRKKSEICPYSNYIRFILEQDLGKITDYWTQYLSGVTNCQFPKLSQTRTPPGQKVEFSRTTLTVSDKMTLETGCRKLDVTLPIIFQAAWSIVLAVYLNTDDVVFGLLCHGRDAPIPGAQEIIGPMATVVPIRAQLPVTKRILELINALHEDNIAHMSYQAISLARIQHTIKRSADSIFNTLLNFQKTSTASFSSGVKYDLLNAHDTSEYDLAVCINEDKDRLDVTIEYPKDFMSEAQAQRLLAVYLNTIDCLVGNPNGIIKELNLATRLDREQIQEWNSEDMEASKRCIHEMISDTTLYQPSKPAISSWDGDLTYAQLDLLSTKLAAQLQAIGAKPDEVVVLCFEKSLWAVVAMLAVAKSGAAFVHIDPKGAPKRTEFVIKHTKARIGLASLEQYDNFISFVDTILIINKPSVMGLPTPGVKDVVSASAEPSNTLYIIFTSGTTGTPKGVVIQHESFCSAVVANKSWLQIKPNSRVLQFTNYCFDASLEEIFTVLVAGGCICIPSDKERMTDIPGFVKRKKVNWAAFTPSFLRTLDPQDLKPVKFITVHAEPMDQDLIKRWADKIHMRPSYGPTECSVTSTVGLQFSVDTDATNIGFPVGCRGWVVHPDNHDILMPIGAIGELLLDGPIVGKGYLFDDAKTKAAFIDPPLWAVERESIFGSSPKRKLYKTGDLVRYAEDGSLLIQRRKDDSQVKVRGQRVELDEIQHHLNKVSREIQHNAILVPKAGLLKGRLVAVASLTALSAGIDTGNYGVQALKTVDREALGSDNCEKVNQILSNITAAMERDLPSYMIPETWLIVQSLPVQLSLKLDYRRVVSWVEGLDKKTLQSVLELGQYRSSMQVMRLCRASGLQVTTQEVLLNQTIKQLAVVAARASLPPKSLIPTPPRSPDDEFHLSSFAKKVTETDSNVESVFPCSPFQERMYNAFQNKAQKPYLFNSLVCLENIGQDASVNLNKLFRAWQQTVDCHSILRTALVLDPKTKKVFQKVLKRHRADIATLSAMSEHDALRQSKSHLNKTRSALFKSEAPPLSVRIFVTLDRVIYVHFVMSHVLIDHVSLAHVFSDFSRFYGDQVPTPGITTSFGYYIENHCRTKAIHANNKFWVETMKNTSPCMVSSESLVSSTADPHSMDSINFSLSITDELREFSRGTEVTLSSLLQFTWAMVLHVYTGHSTVCFGHLASDRDIDLPQAEEIVGPMLSLMIARAVLNDSSSLIEALRDFQNDCIRSLQHKIFDLTEVERQLGYEKTGLFNTLVNYRKVKYSGVDANVNFRSIWKQDPHELQQFLVLAFNEKSLRIEASLTFYESIYSKQTINTLAEAYSGILEMVVCGQHRTVGDMKSVLSP